KGGPVDKAVKDAAKRRVDAAHRAYEADWKLMNEEPTGLRDFLWAALKWSHKWQEAEVVEKDKKEGRLAAAEAHLQRTQKIEQLASKQDAEKTEVLTAVFYRADAEVLVSQAKAGSSKPIRSKAAKDRLDAAKAVYELFWKRYLTGPGYYDHIYQWSMHWRNASLALAATKAEEVAAMEAHLNRMKELHKLVEEKFHGKLFDAVYATDFYQ